MSKSNEISGQDKIFIQKITKDFYLLDDEQIRHILSENRLTIKNVEFIGTANWYNAFAKRVLVFGVIAANNIESLRKAFGASESIAWNTLLFNSYNPDFNVNIIPVYTEDYEGLQDYLITEEIDLPNPITINDDKKYKISLKIKNGLSEEVPEIDKTEDNTEITIDNFEEM